MIVPDYALIVEIWLYPETLCEIQIALIGIDELIL
jgi:hypothetical protein